MKQILRSLAFTFTVAATVCLVAPGPVWPQDPNIGGSIRINDRMTPLSPPHPGGDYNFASLREMLRGLIELQHSNFRLSNAQLTAIRPALERVARGRRASNQFSGSVSKVLTTRQQSYINYLKQTDTLNKIPVFTPKANKTPQELLLAEVTDMLLAKAGKPLTTTKTKVPPSKIEPRNTRKPDMPSK